MIAALVGATALLAPTQGTIPVAFVLSEGATMIDFAGPWEVFQDVHVEGRGSRMADRMPFRLYTVSDSRAPIRISGGMKVTPDYTFADAPAPRIVVIGAQGGKSKQMLDWLRRAAGGSEVVMSVCTGAYKLAMAGLLDGKKAATHHDFWDDFQRRFPKVSLERGARYVRSDPVIFTAGGLTSGIDLALHIVELYFGRDIAARTAAYMEYEGKGWMRQDG
jgi:transcriptional regulator GlxA family with amidase domain